MKISPQKIFTSRQASVLLNVTVPTLINWINDGKISSHKLPGGANRIQGSELIRFMEECGMPISNNDESNNVKLLIVDSDQNSFNKIKSFLSNNHDLDIKMETSGIQAALIAKEFMPDVVIIDIKVIDIDPVKLCESFRNDTDLKDLFIIALCDKENDCTNCNDKCFDVCIEKPLNKEKLLNAINQERSVLSV